MRWTILNQASKWVAILLLAPSVLLGSAQASGSMTAIDRETPEFSLPGLEDVTWDREALKGKVWVVNFWATWCPPCIEELPSMNRAWSQLEPEGIGMLAINAGEDRFDVEAFLGRVPIDFTTVLGGLDTLPNWSVRALPTTIVIDKTGRVVLEALGPREWDDPELLQQVVDLL